MTRTSDFSWSIQTHGMRWGIVITILVVLGWMGTLSHAEDQLVEISNSRDMIGKPVTSLKGKTLGTINDVVINWQSDGYSEYAVLSFGGFFGLGVEYVAVPWKALSPSDNKEHFVLNMKEDHLKDIPGFIVYRFYDRSSVAVRRAGRSSRAQSSHITKGDIGSDFTVSVPRVLPMQYAMKDEVHR